MPWPTDVQLMHAYGHFVNAELWVSLPFGAVGWVRNPSLLARLKRKLVYQALDVYKRQDVPCSGHLLLRDRSWKIITSALSESVSVLS